MRFIVVLYPERTLIARSTEADVIKKTVGVLRISEPMPLTDAVTLASVYRKKIVFTEKALNFIKEKMGA